MSVFPDWVPREVIDYWCMLVDEKNHPLLAKVSDEDIDVLVYSFESPEMENAWKAIASRSDRSDPRAFAHAIVEISCDTRNKTLFPGKPEIAKFVAISKKLSKLQEQFEDAIDKSTGARRSFWRTRKPLEPLKELQGQVDYYIGVCKHENEFFKKLVGKPNSESWRRAWVIRRLTDLMWEMYGQPLHEVVAATSGVILDEDVDSELVRKLMKGYDSSHYEDSCITPDDFENELFEDWGLFPEDS